MCSFYLFCNWFIYILYIIFLIGGSFLCIFSYSYPDFILYDYNDGLIKIDETYHYLSEYPHIKKLIDEYSSMIIKYNDISFDCCYHFYLIPSFSILAIIFSFRFMIFKIDNLIFIISEILLFIIKGIAIIDSFLYHKKLKSLPQIEKDKRYGEFEGDVHHYEDMINNENLGFIFFLLGLLIIEFILFLIFLCINYCNKEEKSNDSKGQSIIIYTIFGFTLFVMLNFYEMNIIDCNTDYINLFKSDFFKINRTYTIINNTKIYLSLKRKDDYEKIELYTEFKYYYSVYPILEKIYKIHKKNSKKKFEDQKAANIDSSIYFIFRFAFVPFFSFVTWIFSFVYKYKNKTNIFYYVCFMFLLLVNLVTIILPTIIVKNYGYEQNLKIEDENIKYILDDYNQYAKCINKFPLGKIIEFIFLIILILILIYDMKLFYYCTKKIREVKIIPEYVDKKIKVRFRVECFLKTFEIIESINQKLNIVLENLLLKYEELKKYKIKYIKYSRNLIYSGLIMTDKTLEEINYKKETELEIILKKERDLLFKFKNKWLNNEEVFNVKVSLIDKFKDVIELLKENYNELNNTAMDNIICYQYYSKKVYKIINGEKDYEKYIKDLNINTNEIIFFEINNKSTLSNTAKKQLSKKIKLEFFHLNMSKTYIVEIFKQNTFRILINILKDKYPELKETNFDEIFIEEDESTKKYIVKNEKDLDKKIEEILKIGDEDNDNIFYIDGDFIDSFDLQLCHVTQNYHKYTIKAGKKELFHNAI